MSENKRLGSHIIEEMLKKAEQAEADGNSERAEHWLKRAGEVEAKLNNTGDTNDGKKA